MGTKSKLGSAGDKIKSFVGHVKVYTEYYFAIVSALGIIWGAFVVYDKWRDDNAQLKNDVRTIMSTQREQTKTDSLLLLNQEEIQKQLENIQLKTEETSQSLQSLQRSYIKYISNDKSLTKEDFLKYMDGLSYDVKKNSSTIIGIQGTPPTASKK